MRRSAGDIASRNFVFFFVMSGATRCKRCSILSGDILRKLKIGIMKGYEIKFKLSTRHSRYKDFLGAISDIRNQQNLEDYIVILYISNQFIRN